MSEANLAEMGKQFFKIVQAKTDAEVSEVLTDNDCNDLLEHYTIASDADDEMISSTDLGSVTIHNVQVVAAVWGHEQQVRIYTNNTLAFKDANGDYWVDYELHDTVFC